MKKDGLKKLSNIELKKKNKSIKTLIFLLLITTFGLLLFGIRDYLNKKSSAPVTIITICTIGGLILLLPEQKNIQKELHQRRL